MTEVDTIIDAEVVIEQLDDKRARSLDKRIRLIVENIQSNWDKLTQLVAEAKAGQIHHVLGFKSWPEYLADALRVEPHGTEERRELGTMLSREGLSQRVIAEILGTTQQTVSNDLARGQVTSDLSPDTPATTGRDGKSYKREPVAPVEEEAPEEPEPKPAPSKGKGKSNQRHQIKALETLGRELGVTADVLQGLFQDGLQKTCTDEIRNINIREARRQWARINGVLKKIEPQR